MCFSKHGAASVRARKREIKHSLFIRGGGSSRRNTGDISIYSGTGFSERFGFGFGSGSDESHIFGKIECVKNLRGFFFGGG